MKNRGCLAFRLLSLQTAGYGNFSVERWWWAFSGICSMCIVLLSACDEGNHNNNTFLSPLHPALYFLLVHNRRAFFPSPTTPFRSISRPLLRLSAIMLSFPRWPPQEPVCDLAAAVNLEGRPQPSDTLFNASWAPQRLRVFLCGRRAASLIYLHWSWHLNLRGYLQNALRPIISNVWVLNALMCSIKIEQNGTDSDALSFLCDGLTRFKDAHKCSSRPVSDWNSSSCSMSSSRGLVNENPLE